MDNNSPQIQKNKIMIALNTLEERHIILNFLKEKEYEIVETDNLNEALQISQNEAPDLIITTSGKNEFGSELTNEMKANVLTRNVPILHMTGPSEVDKAEAISSGADDLISRPISRTELLFRIERLAKEKTLLDEFKDSVPDSINPLSKWENESDYLVSAKKPVVLIVDDNKLIRVQLKDYVESLGHSVITAPNGQKAFEVTQNYSLDLILLDILLPDLGGIELLEMIRQQKNLLQLPVIIISSLSSSESKLKALELGADDYITKPVDFEELQVKMKAVLQKKFYFEEVTQNYHLAVKRAITDSLTELYNHGYFHEFLEREVERCRRYHHPLSLILADIDNFKNYNDIHGHPQGDIVLKTVADIFKQSTRSTDLAARYGGEEFALVLPETEMFGAQVVAEKIRATVEKQKIKGEEQQPQGRVTISLGISSLPVADKETTAIMLINKADQALYEAKEKGRNRVISHPLENTTPLN